MTIKQISREEQFKILTGRSKKENQGLFFSEAKENEKITFTAIKNLKGEALTKVFNDFLDLLKWFKSFDLEITRTDFIVSEFTYEDGFQIAGDQ